MAKSRYRLGKRALRQAQTHERIVAATAELHAEIGPAATTISAVAERAGVQRLTIYRHFPDEAALFAACSAHASERHPPPNPVGWNGIEEPGERLEAALRELYAYYAERGQGLAKVLRDAEELPGLAAALTPMRDYMEGVAEGLSAGWDIDAQAARPFRAALAHALDFWSWRSLEAHGLGTAEAAGLMGRFVRAAAESDAPADATRPR